MFPMNNEQEQGNFKAGSVHILNFSTVFEIHIVEICMCPVFKKMLQDKLTNSNGLGICIQYTKELKGLLKISGRV
jgi:hypothetical protein